MGVKIAVIGGASTYTPELVEGFVTRSDRLPVDELVLHDIDAERLEIVGGLARRMLDRRGFGGTLTLTSDRTAAIDGADYVIVQLRVGGQAARLRDETIPLRFGCIGQETTGPGGLRQGAAHRARRARHRRGDGRARAPTARGSSTSRTRSAS